MTSPVRDYTLIKTRIENDPYSPVLVEDLINGLNDWRSVQDIVRLTFKALSDVVKSQGASLKEIEVNLPGKASKAEISQCLLMKNTYNDVIRNIAELKTSIESKMSTDDVYSIVEEKISRSDLQYLLGTKASYEELRTSLSEKADLREVQSELRALRAIIEEMNEENYRKISQCASKRDLQQLQSIVEVKANKDEVNEALEDKANKQSVANALHRKANKSDIDSILAGKAELAEFNKFFESFQSFQAQYIQKTEKAEVSRKSEKNDTESLFYSLQNSQKESEAKIFGSVSKLEGYLSSLKAKLDEVQSSLVLSINKKCDIRDFDKLGQVLMRKADTDQVKDSVNSIQTDAKEQFQCFRYDFHKLEEIFNEKWQKLDMSLKNLQSDLLQAHENIRIVAESSRANLEEGVKSVHHYTGSKLEEIRILKQEIDRLHRDYEELRLSGVDKAEFRKTIESKVDVKELKEFVERNGRELARQLQLSNEEMKDLILRKEKELTLIIDKKPGVHEISSLILENSVSRLHKSEESYRDERVLKVSNFRDPTIEALQKDFSRLKLEVDNRINLFMNDQNSLNEVICSENCLAR